MRSLYARTLLFTLLALCAAARGASGRQAAPALDWREFKSEAGGFSIKLPGEPRVTSEPMVRGPLTFTRNVHAAAAGEYEFVLDYIDMPAGYNDPGLTLEGGIGALIRFAESKGGSVLTNGKVTRSTCEGREATANIPSPSGKSLFLQARAFNSGQRYYSIVFTARADTEAARVVGRAFHDSLVINDGCKAPLAPAVAPTSPPVRGTVEGTRDPATGWRRIESPEHGFSLLMPGPAQRESAQSQVQPFPLSRHEFFYEGEGIVYSAEVVGEYPAGFYSKATSLEHLLDATLVVIKRTFASLEVTYAAPRKLSAGDYLGREYVVTNDRTGVRGRIQIYATPLRTYIFIALSVGPTPRDTEIERFFSSVRVSTK